MSSKLILFLPAVMLLASCETPNPVSGSVDPNFGEAVKYNAAIQTINPEPVYTADSAQPGSNGEKGQQAVERYRTDKVKPVETLSTTRGVSGGSGGGSGGGR
jgi:hypothetical protein